MDRTDHFLSIADWSAEALQETLALAHRLKADPAGQGRPLAGKTLAMVFAKSSTRTRVSFEVGTYQLGGHALFLSSRDIQLGRGEPIADTSRVLSRYVDGVMIRTFAQSDVEDFARAGTVPVVNGLTDLLHPCQLMADVMTIQEEFGQDVSGLERRRQQHGQLLAQRGPAIRIHPAPGLSGRLSSRFRHPPVRCGGRSS
jgi:ornithine carbamoyltransferase